jgi:hypothetical protein
MSVCQGQAEQQDKLGAHMATCLYPSVLWYRSCCFVSFMLSLLCAHAATNLFLVFCHTVSDLWREQSFVSEVGTIVPKSTIPNYINEVRGKISYGFRFGNNWLDIGTSSPFLFLFYKNLSQTLFVGGWHWWVWSSSLDFRVVKKILYTCINMYWHLLWFGLHLHFIV